MKKYKFEEMAEIEKELIDDFFEGSKKDELDKLIKECELNIKNEERLKAIKCRYLLMLCIEDNFICLRMFKMFSPEILEYFLPKLSLLTRIKEILTDE